MANTPNLGLPQNNNWTTGEVETWAKSINDENDINNAFMKIDTFAGSVKQVPTGGTTNQVLTKTATGYAWKDLPLYNGEVV